MSALKNDLTRKSRVATDAVVRITHTAICGSDLWYYRGQREHSENSPIGHEPMGIVESVGDAVRHVEPGDRVLAPFTVSCGSQIPILTDLLSAPERLAAGSDIGSNETVV